MGALSRLTGDPRFESAALRSLRKLWSMRSSLNLLGTTLDVETGEWIEYSSGIGAGMSSDFCLDFVLLHWFFVLCPKRCLWYHSYWFCYCKGECPWHFIKTSPEY